VARTTWTPRRASMRRSTAGVGKAVSWITQREGAHSAWAGGTNATHATRRRRVRMIRGPARSARGLPARAAGSARYARLRTTSAGRTRTRRRARGASGPRGSPAGRRPGGRHPARRSPALARDWNGRVARPGPACAGRGAPVRGESARSCPLGARSQLETPRAAGEATGASARGAAGHNSRAREEPAACGSRRRRGQARGRSETRERLSGRSEVSCQSQKRGDYTVSKYGTWAFLQGCLISFSASVGAMCGAFPARAGAKGRFRWKLRTRPMTSRSWSRRI
jgi:hypothetical protein